MLLLSFANLHAQQQVGVMDLRKEELHNAQWNAARYSNNGLIILYMGNDDDLFAKVHQGVNNAYAKGTPIQGIVRSQPTPDFENGKDCYVLLIGGVSCTKYIAATDLPIRRAESMSRKAYERFSYALDK